MQVCVIRQADIDGDGEIDYAGMCNQTGRY